MDYALVQAANGLVLGIIFAVIAVGLTLVFAVLKIVNFAHGELYMMGGYFAYYAIGLLVLMAVVYIMSRTAAGHALDAVSQSRESAAIVGIDPRLAYTLGFGLGGALAGAAGALMGPIFSLSPSMGILPDTQAFVIVI